MNRRTLLTNVRLVSQVKHLTAHDIAEKSGIEEKLVENWLTDSEPAAIPIIHVHALAMALGTTEEQLYGWD